LLEHMKKNEIISTFHYVPLHSAPAGKKYARTVGDMKNTNHTSDCMIRLPMYSELEGVERVIETVLDFFRKR
jgi:dTDP-4-amino-4,6-dideoxygalactose transaminase